MPFIRRYMDSQTSPTGSVGIDLRSPGAIAAESEGWGLTMPPSIMRITIKQSGILPHLNAMQFPLPRPKMHSSCHPAPAWT